VVRSRGYREVLVAPGAGFCRSDAASVAPEAEASRERNVEANIKRLL